MLELYWYLKIVSKDNFSCNITQLIVLDNKIAKKSMNVTGFQISLVTQQ